MDEKKDLKIEHSNAGSKAENPNIGSDEKDKKKEGSSPKSAGMVDDSLKEKSKQKLKKKIEDKLQKQREILSKAAEDEFRSSGKIVSDKVRDELEKFNEISECYSDVAKNMVGNNPEKTGAVDSESEPLKLDKEGSESEPQKLDKEGSEREPQN